MFSMTRRMFIVRAWEADRHVLRMYYGRYRVRLMQLAGFECYLLRMFLARYLLVARMSGEFTRAA